MTGISFIDTFLSLGGLIYTIVTLVIIYFIMRQRNFPSNDRKEIVLYAIASLGISIIVCLVLNLIFGGIAGKGIFLNQRILLFFILPIKLVFLNYVIIAIGIFETLYSFVYLKNRLNFQNIKLYIFLDLLLFGLTFLTYVNPRIIRSMSALIFTVIFTFIIIIIYMIIEENNSIIKS